MWVTGGGGGNDQKWSPGLEKNLNFWGGFIYQESGGGKEETLED